MLHIDDAFAIDTEALEAAFWSEVETLHHQRGHRGPLPKLPRSTAQAVFSACMLALEDREAGCKLHRTLASGTGTGKSSYAGCFASALLKASPEASVALVVPTIQLAEDAYLELTKLVDEADVAIWTGGHDMNTSLEKIRSDNNGFQPKAPRFFRSDLSKRRLIVVTHKFYISRGGTDGVLSYNGDSRTLHLIDERLQEVELMDLDLADFTNAMTFETGDPSGRPEVAKALTDLHSYLNQMWRSEKVGKPGSFKALASEALEWFASNEAAAAETWSKRTYVQQAIGFGRALVMGRAFLARYPEAAGGDDEGESVGPHSLPARGHGGRFVGYRLDIPLVPGSVLMDGTSDIDGVNQIATWRAPVAPPRVTFDRLSIKHLPFPVVDPDGFKKNVKAITDSATLSTKYATWIKETILRETEPGESILVVTHKAMIQQGRLPSNDTFDDPFIMEGDRKVVFLTYGQGVGSNRYKQATTVFLCGEFWKPHRISVAELQGLRNVKAEDGDLAEMANVKTKHALLATVRNGHLLMWAKQLAMRGAARNFDGDGVCGKMKLVAIGDLELWMQAHAIMFPGASFDMSEASKAKAKEAGGSNAVAAFIFGHPKGGEGFTSKDLLSATGLSRTHLPRYLKSSVVQKAMEDGGWSYIPGQGRSPSRFVRWGSDSPPASDTADAA